MKTKAEPGRGLVLAIHRFSLNDGPGIRTTVFLKGCPLRCLWCHNPESQSFAPETLQAAGDQPEETVGSWRSVPEVMAEVLRDRVYYEKSGGGLTLSGGEPAAQAPFSLELLRSARNEGLHTCLETSGHAPWTVLSRMSPFVNLFLYDMKGSDPALHRAHTTVSNDRILSNLRRLHDQGASILLRCPLIPGFNDSPEDLGGLAAIAASLPSLAGVEIMPYHDMGSGKARRLGRSFGSPGIQKPGQDEVKNWVSHLRDLSCAVSCEDA